MTLICFLPAKDLNKKSYDLMSFSLASVSLNNYHIQCLQNPETWILLFYERDSRKYH